MDADNMRVRSSGQRSVKFWILASISILIINYFGSACTQSTTVHLIPAPTAQAIPEIPYCSTPQSFADSVTVTGKALFNIRQTTASGLGGEILQPLFGGAIRFAEVQITDGSGQTITCGETNGTGNYTLQVPRNQSLKVNVFSRSKNDHVNVSVLDSPQTNRPYTLTSAFSTNVSSGSTVTVPDMIASAKGDVLGGAFNIHFNILRANETLRYLVCGLGSLDLGCASFSVAPKVSAYWSKGVNPYTYFGNNSPLSFYSLGTDQLFILGGSSGDVDNSDTDHFDDAVISHEYGHFIEDHYAQSDSPGGSHDGSSVLDARLMWSEGWADFFSSLVRGNKFYIDTYGNSDGTTGLLFDYDIDRNRQGSSRLDLPENPSQPGVTVSGLGNFHEFAITRALWDIVDPLIIRPGGSAVGVNGGLNDDNTFDSTTSGFTTLWSVFTGPFHNPNFHFRNIGLFFNNDSDPNLATNPQLLSQQGILSTKKDYGATLALSPGQADCPVTITSSDNPSGYHNINSPQLNCSMGDRTVFCSNQFFSNDFYDVTLDGTFSSISLVKTSGPAAEINLYLFKEKYNFDNVSDIVSQGPVGIFANGIAKPLSVGGLSAGHYMLNINVNTSRGNPGALNYQLYVDGNKVCPQ